MCLLHGGVQLFGFIFLKRIFCYCLSSSEGSRMLRGSRSELCLSSPAYQITHRLNSSNSNTAAVEVLSPSARQYTVTGLWPESVYVFRITAQTRKGWGEAAGALVVTTEKRGNLSSPPIRNTRLRAEVCGWSLRQ